MSDPFKDSPFALLTDYRELDRRNDAVEAKIQSRLAEIRTLQDEQHAYTTAQCRIVARLAPAFARVGVVKFREGYDDLAVSHDPDCDFLTFAKLHDASDLDMRDLGSLAAALSRSGDAVLKAFNADDTGEYPPIAVDLAVIDQEAS
jgi:hypothetical protein